jgi:hypothetical protein
MTTTQHRCMYGGCPALATCMPRLYIPGYQLNTFRENEPMTMMLGLHVCDAHFKKLKVSDFLRGERGRELREAANTFWRALHTRPNFDRATIGRVSQRDHDYKRIKDMEKRRVN